MSKRITGVEGKAEVRGYLDPEMALALRILALKEGVGVRDLVARACENLLVAHGDKPATPALKPAAPTKRTLQS
jgi:hypothetical protein